MVEISPETDPTLEAVDREQEKAALVEKPRPYLGMSGIGHDCLRKLWLDFRWASRRSMGARSLRAIQDGHAGELVMIDRLLMVDGVILSVSGGEAGQIGVSDHAGHFRGHLDGIITGILQAPKTTHVWEHKQVNDQKFRVLLKAKGHHGEKSALAEWDEGYYAQAQCYMAYMGLKRHYLTVATPGGREYISVRTNYDKTAAKRLQNKALEVITAPGPFEKIATDPSFYKCKWCDHYRLCHQKQFPEVSCRTCSHATPELDGDGRWSCRLLECQNDSINLATQREGCQRHLFLPPLVPNCKPTDSDPAYGWIEYRENRTGRIFRNGSGEGCLSSLEMRRNKQ